MTPDHAPPTPHRGVVPGATPEARTVRAAGLLAELGVASLTLTVPDQPPRPLAARVTDLPGELRGLSAWSVVAPGLTLIADESGVAWQTADADLAARIHRAFPTPGPD
jgi:hypothetical protein